ncbi:PAS domain-containing hybrid sensor histidine kinase/response regulator [Gillisia hiemivivida]|uniref:histidine kinase n=1 Tax=Gillisia hiemivivida TaxID=291190 RepID=A0A5C6ZR46_9FLAO|nr:PAS domain-containing hybrid sensor histidine kinase/response regulator [Gillisia hiemivivida]TXD92083.1 response regulator [Gillisia hiemivivida]
MSITNKHSIPKGKVTETAEELYENSPCGYVSFLTDGTIYNINRTLLSWLNSTKEEIIYVKKFPDLFKIGGQIFFETHFFPLIRMQGFIQEINFDIVKKDRSSFPGLINVNEIPAKGKNPLTYRATIFDITDRKKYEKELMAAKKKAEEDSHAKAEFLSTISHEIRTPLHAILGIGNLLSKTHLNEDQKEYARILLLSSENLLGLVNNLLDLSKIEAEKVELEKRDFNIKNMVKMLQQTFRVKAAEKNIDLLVEMDENVPQELSGDPIKLSQILTNLIGNAIKFTKKGSVSIIIEHLETGSNESLFGFKVCDTGMGIPQDKLEAIFQEFSQASYDVNLEYGGTGLGLTISQKLLHLHKSEMKVQSIEGQGSEFSFEIWYEVNENYSCPKDKKISTEDRKILESSRVLVVDDNPANIYITAQFLNDWKLENESAKSGFEAIEMLRKKDFDLILLDLHMPKLNGYKTAKEIRALKLKKQPILIALSASERGEINYKLKKAGFQDHVPKPFQPEKLLEMLVHYLHNPDHQEMKKYPLTNLESVEEMVDEKEIQAVKNTSQPQLGQSPSFNVSKFVKMSNHNALYLDKFIKSTLDALVTYEQEFLDAVKANSTEMLGDLIHKSTMSMFYIQADNLSKLMEEVRILIEKDVTATEILQKKSKACTAEFKKIIEGLKKLKAGEILAILD